MDWNALIFGVDVGRSWWLTSLGSLRHPSPFVEICKLGASAQADAPAPGGLSPRVTIGFNFKPAEVACSARICTATATGWHSRRACSVDLLVLEAQISRGMGRGRPRVVPLSPSGRLG